MSSCSSRVQFMEKHPKAKFAHTCNLLSRYVKEKGSLRDLNLEIDGKIESLETIVRPKHQIIDKGKSVLPTTDNQPPVIDLVEDFGPDKLASSSKLESTSKTADANSKTQLTIIYGGRILVFDDFPTQKVREVVALAKKGSSQMSYGISTTTSCLSEKSSNKTSPSYLGLPPRPPPHHQAQNRVVSSNSTLFEHRTTSVFAMAASTSSEAANGSDLPIARRASLHRFLGKIRKDRAAARGPYHHHQVPEQPSSSSFSNHKLGDDNDDEHLQLKL